LRFWIARKAGLRCGLSKSTDQKTGAFGVKKKGERKAMRILIIGGTGNNSLNLLLGVLTLIEIDKN
jgi:hypothetical protein